MKKRFRPRQKPGADEGKVREETIWGVHAVSAMLQCRPQQVLALFITPGRANQRISEILELAIRHRIVVHHDQPLPLTEPESIPHQGVVARIKPLVLLDLNALLARLTAQDLTRSGLAEPGLPGSDLPPLVLALDSIQDPHNLGAIIRCAAAFGVKALIFPKDRSAPLTGTVMKAAAGTAPLLHICQVTNLAETLTRLKEHGFWIYGAGGDAPQSLYAAEFSGPICLVMGNEQKGLRPLVRRYCDHLIAIPLARGVESLNVAVATGIILAEITRQSGAGGRIW
ncbi:MAG: 23S rRNA (guanosine(2251)-2'-O)-methyltransferase RlmB [Desulfobulbaceae bacterium]|nr:MAG: 23S rRNA (guanosine(2251)-2'-O)-methyltransferase RlmB [Desulfobulbaceae bacterium]